MIAPRRKTADESFPSTRRLRLPGEFQRVLKGGWRWTGRFVVVYLDPGQGDARFGLTVSRRVGGAVTRNRLKRRLREVFRRDKGAWPAADVVVRAQPPAAGASLDELAAELRAAMACWRRRAERTGSKKDSEGNTHS